MSLSNANTEVQQKVESATANQDRFYGFHDADQKQVKVMPVYEELTESELDIIANHHGLDKYEVEVKEQHDQVNGEWKFDCYIYILSYS